MVTDLISRQAALDIINIELNGWLTEDERLHLEGVGTGIEFLPTIDPVKHGKWIEYPIADEMNQCSECGILHFGESNYCQNCGAKMDLEEGEKDGRQRKED